MRTLVVYVLLITCGGCLADYFQSSSYFCTDLKPQQSVIIKQLEGIWYVKEKIIHTEERHYSIDVATCPVIHISEDRSQSTTYNPSNKVYDTTYGSGYSYDSEQDYSKQQEEYDQRTTYDFKRRKLTHKDYTKYSSVTKHLRIYWDDNSYSTEYHLKYNINKPGFWISSGPEDGRIPDERKHFAGTVQVLKAVGNHLVLTFCHPEAEKKLFTVILSREYRLDNGDIYNVHDILIRHGLSTNAVEKSCNKAPLHGINLFIAAFVSTFYFGKLLMFF